MITSEAARQEIQKEQWLAGITAEVLKTLNDNKGMCHLREEPLPHRETVVSILNDLREILYPGFGSRQNLHSRNVEYHIGSLLDKVYDQLSEQIARALRHELCHEAPHTDFTGLAQSKAIEFLRRLGGICRLLEHDVTAAYRGDPAAKNRAEIIFCYPGLEAMTIFRIAHELYTLGVPYIPRMMTEFAHSKTGIDIHPGAKIGPGFFIDHGTGVVIGETCVIGSNVKLYQGVTLGALSFKKDADGELVRGTKRHPTLEDDVIVYANATILGGNTVIGARSIIGSNVWLTNSVAPETVVVLEKPQLRVKGNGGKDNDFPQGIMYHI